MDPAAKTVCFRRERLVTAPASLLVRRESSGRPERIPLSAKAPSDRPHSRRRAKDCRTKTGCKRRQEQRRRFRLKRSAQGVLQIQAGQPWRARCRQSSMPNLLRRAEQNRLRRACRFRRCSWSYAFRFHVQPRRPGKILAGFKRPSGLKTRFTRIMESRSASLKTRPMKSFFS